MSTFFQSVRSVFQRTRKWLLDKPPLSRDYRDRSGPPWQRFSLESLPPFTLWQADVMLMDPHVVFGLMVRNGAIAPAQVNWSGDPRQVRFAQQQWNRIWHDFGGALLRTKRYGWMPFEVTYHEIAQGEFQGMLGVKGLHDFHPRDGRVVLRGSEKAGVRFGSSRDAGDGMLPFPASLWCTFDSQFGNPYGRSLNQNSYVPFEEKWRDHGAKDVLRLRMMKDGYSGDIFWVPDQVIEIPDPVTQEKKRYHAIDLFRRAQETRLAGASMTLPRLFGSHGEELTGYEPPHDNGRPEGILEWNERLDWEIWKGQGVIREVFEAASSGSGFSGRTVPMIHFLGMVTEEFKSILADVMHDLLRPLTHINFGRDPDLSAEVRPLMETYAEAMSGSALGGSSFGGSRSDPARPAEGSEA
ncbi:hypothetical protein AB1L30_05425 [Bremerella sp. JC817]|uniref:hypothetical protein n=1 Tax=Bremerella sp. JC817 TaxID=3231756 RepID=UPI003459B8C9